MTRCVHGHEKDEFDDRDCQGCRHDAGLVSCDNNNCKAKSDPQTTQELRDAVEHWRRHGYLSGCSHGS
jgi:hypothetical protein